MESFLDIYDKNKKSIAKTIFERRMLTRYECISLLEEFSKKLMQIPSNSFYDEEGVKRFSLDKEDGKLYQEYKGKIDSACGKLNSYIFGTNHALRTMFEGMFEEEDEFAMGYSLSKKYTKKITDIFVSRD